LFIKIPFHENTGTYDSSGRDWTLERSVPTTKPKDRQKSEKSPENRAFSQKSRAQGPAFRLCIALLADAHLATRKPKPILGRHKAQL
jgi:hypothetical protein